MIKHFRLHGEQHVADIGLIHAGKLIFSLEDSSLTESLNKDMLLEIRAMLRQLINKSLPFYTLEQIINFERERMDGSHSEYAWAGHALFLRLSQQRGEEFEDGKWWVSGVEALDELDIYQLAIGTAYKEKNFVDMLTEEQKKEAEKLLHIN